MTHTAVINTDIWVGLMLAFLLAMLFIIRRSGEKGYIVLELWIVACMVIILFKVFVPTWGW